MDSDPARHHRCASLIYTHNSGPSQVRCARKICHASRQTAPSSFQCSTSERNPPLALDRGSSTPRGTRPVQNLSRAICNIGGDTRRSSTSPRQENDVPRGTPSPLPIAHCTRPHVQATRPRALDQGDSPSMYIAPSEVATRTPDQMDAPQDQRQAQSPPDLGRTTCRPVDGGTRHAYCTPATAPPPTAQWPAPRPLFRR